MKRSITFYLLIAVLCAVIFGALSFSASAEISAPAAPSGEGTEADPYQIGTADELFWFALNVGNKPWYAELTADITINEDLLDENGDLNASPADLIPWTSIGGIYNYYAYLDGKGYTISGIYCEADWQDGLIRSASGGYVKNLSIRDSYFTSNENYIGAIMGYGEAEIDNCHVSATVISTGDRVGGIAGYVDGVVKNCSFSGKVQGNSVVGGIIGQGNVENCFNAGTVSGNTDVGGVAGYIYAPTNYVKNSYNVGSVSGTERVGGVLGDTLGGSVLYCYNAGAVNGSLDTRVVGTDNAEVEGCYTISSTDNGEGKTEAQFKSGEVAFLLNGSASQGELVWGQSLDNGEEVDAYPTLRGAFVYKVQINCTDYGYSNKNEDISTAHKEKYIYSVNEADKAKHDVYYSCHSDVFIKTEEHTYAEDGVCICLAGMEVPLIESGEYAGYYEIKTAGHLYWFAATVNEGNLGYNAVLANDITVNKNVIVNGELSRHAETFREWKIISDYNGVLDGNGYEIKGLYICSDSGFGGLFEFLGTNAKVKNLGLTDCYFSLTQYIGGIAVSNYGTIDGCSFSGIITSKYSIVGGITAMNSGTVVNCYNVGDISGYAQIGGIVGSNSGEILNSYNAGSVIGGAYVNGIFGYGDGSAERCYYLNSVENESGGKTEAQFRSGEVAYLLGAPFGQKLGTEEAQAFPVFSQDRVYRGYYTCNDPGYSYGNESESLSELPPCDFGDGSESICRAGCGRKNFSLVTVISDAPSGGYTFNGSTFSPELVLKSGDEVLQEDIHYTVRGVVSALMPNTYTVVFTTTYDGGYCGEIIYSWSINKAVVSFTWYNYENLVFSGWSTSQRVDASASGAVDGYPLLFDLKGHRENEAGSYTAYAVLSDTSTRYYTTDESATLEWSIAPCEIDIGMFIISAQTYNGGPLEGVNSNYYGFTLGNDKYQLVTGKDYTVEYENNVNAGRAGARIYGIGNFTGELTVGFTIQKAAVTVQAEEKNSEQYCALPDFTYTVRGLRGEDSFISPPILTADTDGKAVGEFTITASGGDAGDNYEIIYVPATLKVTEHTEHRGGTANCENRAICALCEEAYGALGDHLPNSDDGDCTTDVVCSVCGETTAKGADAHVGGTATCTAKARCENCGKEYGALLDHTHSTVYKTDSTSHWNECACGDKASVASHADTNNDEKCDTCGYAMLLTPFAPDEDGANDGLSAGAIVGIAAGAVAVIGLGGFSLLWFVIKKKKLIDLIGVFKK